MPSTEDGPKRYLLDMVEYDGQGECLPACWSPHPPAALLKPHLDMEMEAQKEFQQELLPPAHLSGHGSYYLISGAEKLFPKNIGGPQKGR